jgi:2-methylcitrate dehydratase PrpD
MLDSLFSLMRQHNFSYDDVVNAEVDQSYLSVVMLYADPEDELKGKFSAKYNVAAALVDHEVVVGTFNEKKIADPTIQEVMGKVRTRVLAKSEEGTTDFQKGLPVRITLKDGRVLEHTTAREDILGGQKNPWGFDSIKGKFQVNAGLVFSEGQVAETIETWSDITQVIDVAGAISSTLVGKGS